LSLVLFVKHDTITGKGRKVRKKRQKLHTDTSGYIKDHVTWLVNVTLSKGY